MSEAAPGMHEAATGAVPFFVTHPGESDTLLFVSLIFLIMVLFGIGVFYFWLHALPERQSHKANKVQFEIVAVLALLALFTHNHLFWVGALLLAMVTIPDFLTPVNRIATALQQLAAGRNGSEAVAKVLSRETVATARPDAGDRPEGAL